MNSKIPHYMPFDFNTLHEKGTEYTYTDIATTRPKRPKGRLGEKDSIQETLKSSMCAENITNTKKK